VYTQEEKEFFMKEALKEAEKAKEIAEVPIGAVIVKDGQVIARGYNQRESTNRAITHAEILAIDEANKALDNWRLEDCALFVTVEPCVMCSGAIVLSRIPYVYYGASDYKGGTAGTLMNLLEEEKFNHQAKVEAGVLQEECSEMLTSFFRALRSKKKGIK
jgi:tRNA(adenine34) deaminase